MNVENLIKQKQLYLIKNEDKNIEQTISQHKLQVIKEIREKLIEKFSNEDLRTRKKFTLFRSVAWSLIEEITENRGSGIYLDSQDKAEILETLIQSMFGYGILDPLINDPSITEIMVNGIDKIFVEKNGVIGEAKNQRGEILKFNNNDELMNVVEKIVSPINRKVDESNPIVDARLPNGFRVNILLNPISLDGNVITIRKFPEHPYTMDKLVEFGTLTKEVAELLKGLVRSKYNIIVSGGTGSGKTTFLNALSNYIDPNARIITIEDAAELKLINLKNLIRTETRPPNIEGKGEITMRDLVRTALRMRPDRIIVGEVRGGEALDMLQAMNTGHDGSLSTGHANSSIDMLRRLETMVLMAGVEFPLLSIRQQIASALEIIVHLSKMHDGSRKVVQVTEITGANNDGYITHDLYTFQRGSNKEGEIGRLQKTGEKLKRINKFLFAGFDIE